MLPLNAASERPYRGVNVVTLWATADARGYASGLWGTYTQWKGLGGQVRRDERGTPVVVWKFSEEDQGKEREQGREELGRKQRLFARAYRVFNLEQVDGYSPASTPKLAEAERIAHAEAFFSDLGPRTCHGGNVAGYDVAADTIRMPHFEDFREPGGYYATLAHEATHWSGAGHRLGRDLGGRFGDNAYAVEELVAELGAAFLCAALGLGTTPRPDHASYIAAWLRVLKADSRAIFAAAAKAQQAVDWMQSRVDLGSQAA